MMAPHSLSSIKDNRNDGEEEIEKMGMVKQCPKRRFFFFSVARGTPECGIVQQRRFWECIMFIC